MKCHFISLSLDSLDPSSSKYGLGAKFGLPPGFRMRFYWNPATLIHLHIVHTYFLNKSKLSSFTVLTLCDLAQSRDSFWVSTSFAVVHSFD